MLTLDEVAAVDEGAGIKITAADNAGIREARFCVDRMRVESHARSRAACL